MPFDVSRLNACIHDKPYIIFNFFILRKQYIIVIFGRVNANLKGQEEFHNQSVPLLSIKLTVTSVPDGLPLCFVVGVGGVCIVRIFTNCNSWDCEH